VYSVTSLVRTAAACLATLCAAHAANAQVQAPNRMVMDADTAARVEKLSTDPFRWIILHSKNAAPRPATAAESAAQPQEPIRPKATLEKKSAVNAAKIEAAKRPVLVGRQAVAVAESAPVGAKPATIGVPAPVAAYVPPVAPVTLPAAAPAAQPAATENAGASLQVGKVLADIMDFDGVSLAPNGAILASSGASVFGRPNTFSAKKPNPVLASLDLDKVKKMARLDYEVPESAGSFGGAGIRVGVAGDGIDLSQLVSASAVDGLLSIEVDVTVATTLKVILIGPTERPDGAYPSFRLPVEPGRRTYGLLLTDFATATWVSGAPDIAEVLKNLKGVGVEYTRSSGLSPTDTGVFWVGDIHINQAKQVVSAGK
jgi:hypothetical protein